MQVTLLWLQKDGIDPGGIWCVCGGGVVLVYCKFLYLWMWFHWESMAYHNLYIILHRRCQCSLCQRLGLTQSVRIGHERRARSARVRWRQKTSKATLLLEGQEVLHSKSELSPLHQEGANTQIKKLSLDKRLVLVYFTWIDNGDEKN